MLVCLTKPVKLNVRPAELQMNTSILIERFGHYPHQFLSILENHGKNEHLNQESQSHLWLHTLREHPVPGFDPQGFELWGISDNGDLFFSHGSDKVVIVNHRDNTVIQLNVSADECIENLPIYMPEVFE